MLKNHRVMLKLKGVDEQIEILEASLESRE
ncbi:hypothetical protein SAG0147_03405 [Streptococcus agalactiae MRI Z1-048]|nr:hypothetical protein SAG0053_10265 [Streptococcus agalactiae CCUG 25532]EPT87070.1 hypothetical protein SAG0099_07955 [Streptococcus agalactiae BSU247]EPV21518.1 hypothetical protein SAG0334_06615 [Streptococcus agalactiae GB00640]EPW98661.1 hypothetical protein SAG0147_03405 [Streptococcus agalactiae MRI Z1-048]